MKYKGVVSYSSKKRSMSQLDVGREVVKAIEENQKLGCFEYETTEKRVIIREEVAHHIPVEGAITVVKGLLLKGESGDFEKSCISIRHYGISPSQEVLSALAPLGDKRFSHDLSDEDLKIAENNWRRMNI